MISISERTNCRAFPHLHKATLLSYFLQPSYRGAQVLYALGRGARLLPHYSLVHSVIIDISPDLPRLLRFILVSAYFGDIFLERASPFAWILRGAINLNILITLSAFLSHSQTPRTNSVQSARDPAVSPRKGASLPHRHKCNRARATRVRPLNIHIGSLLQAVCWIFPLYTKAVWSTASWGSFASLYSVCTGA